MDIAAHIREVPDFPKPGILFRDVTPLLEDPAVFRGTLDALEEVLAGLAFERIAAMESRGFVFAAPLCDRLGKGLVLLRKKGKLPRATVSVPYGLEYGQAALEVHRDALQPGQRVVVLDDLLATGGTAEAAGRLVAQLGAQVAAYVFVVELAALRGRALLAEAPVFALVRYE